MEKTTFNHLSIDLWNSECIDLAVICNHPGPENFQKNINYNFKNAALLLEALTHSSFANELGTKSNETLEFLGDSVLDLLVSSKLLQLYPELDEGELSKFRGSLVNEIMLSQMALTIGVDRLILLGRGENANKGYQKAPLLADTFEALLGALYVDGGLSAASLFFDSAVELYNLEAELNYFTLERLDFFDAKSRLQELTMAKFKVLPRYEVEEIEGELFAVSLYINDKFIDKITGASKKKATKELARKVLQEKSYVK